MLPLRAPTIDIVVPVYNEERVLEASITRLRRYLDEEFPFSTQVIIADNASLDGTWAVAERLASQLPGVSAHRLEQKGRGRALRAVWSASQADVVAYMDVDLATDLRGLLPLVAPLLSGHSDVAIGSRLARGACVSRGTRREVISQSYNLLLRGFMRSGFSDAQCGFKALRVDAAQALLPLVVDEAWFFDTELLVLAEANGMRIHEVPVDWTDDPDSRVDVVSTAVDDLRGMLRVSRHLASGGGRVSRSDGAMWRLASRFAGIGGVSTMVYLLLFVALRPMVGLLAADGLALSLAAVLNLAAHRRLFTHDAPVAGTGQHGRRAALAREALVVWLAGVSLSMALLAAISAAGMASTSNALITIVAANAAVSLGRFVSFRSRSYRDQLVPVDLPPILPAVAPSAAPSPVEAA